MKTKSTPASKKSAKKPVATDNKMAAANDVQPVAPVVEPKAEAAPKKAKKTVKPKEEFLVKLRSKGDLLNALKANGILFLENGLWRLDPDRPDHKVHRVSKRRAVAFRAAELVVPTTQVGNRPNSYVLNLAKVAEAAAAEKKSKEAK
jgi:uncharacterized protein (DUF4415 family)